MRDPATIRQRAHMILDLAHKDSLDHFQICQDKFDETAGLIAETIRTNYPDLDVPYHSRWRHFETGGIDRWQTLKPKLPQDIAEQSRIAIDLAVISVLLDAGAGSKWLYTEADHNITIGRSEGLALASFHMFCDGVFSSNPNNPYQVDSHALKNLNKERLIAGFQISQDNPMTGLEGRIDLVIALANALEKHPNLFGKHYIRPGNLFDTLTDHQKSTSIKAKDILKCILTGFSDIWPGRTSLEGENMGDVWYHSKLAFDDQTNQLMPFHKLSQWLTYSLLEPFEWADISVYDLNDLTGLAEYRNGGLFVDSGLLKLKNSHAITQTHSPDSELIVEWRALTVALLDEMRLPVADILGISADRFPLAKLLEGGSWAAGRKLAFKRDPEGNPPIQIKSDGTVF